MYLFYDQSCSWEKDYVIKTLLRNYELDVRFLTAKQIRDPNYFIALHNERSDLIFNNIFLFSSNPDHSKSRSRGNLDQKLNRYEIAHIVKFIRPRVIMHFSDEVGGRGELNLLTHFSPLVLRQYSYSNYLRFKNLLHIPLGYMHKMFEDDYEKIEVKPVDQRQYKWSFVGAMKKDRTEMIVKFRNIKPYKFEKMSAQQMRDLYRDSIFVPNGRGNFHLDCFRLYEATICGAIPVVVGNANEIRTTFSVLGEPPFLYCVNWNDAVLRCYQLLQEEGMVELKKMQKALIDWWSSEINMIRERIDQALKYSDTPVLPASNS